ncbi:translation initiation factor IF-3 [Drechmeria coniospora]|uniref:Translation initiation factor IF-3 n=1 Tax=Drechmeria coniospora TaxID=98403 RepID=A0A151GUS8_DRECN|nr:translation initiation factor IF-3 [Drechmeria coniospora]KYK60857.1 translation initiation factor IF-3 [Drechmeria coniospora]
MTAIRPSNCAFSVRRALYRVFVSPRAPRFPVRSLAANWSWTVVDQARRYAKPRAPPRPASLGAADADDADERAFDRRYTTAKDVERSGRDRPPQDHEITDPQIMVIDGGATEGPLAPAYVLTKLTSAESLRMVRPYVPADAKAGRPHAQLAVCKIVNKRDEYARQKELKEKRKTSAAAKPKSKELELTWSIGDHDLATKMRQMAGFLAKGMKVELMLARKKGGKQVTGDEAADVVRRVRDEATANGAREGKPASGQVGGTMRLYFEGNAKAP